MEKDFNNIDVELLIAEVKSYPELWDLAEGSYYDRTKKRTSWDNICKVFCDDFEMKSDEEKNEIRKIIINKWRNIKDTYVKSLKRPPKSQKRYIFAAKLSFLDKVRTEIRSIQEDAMAEDTEQQRMEKGPKNSPSHDGNSSRKRKRNSEDSFIEFKQSPIPQPVAPPEPNADRSFINRTIPPIKDFTEGQKLDSLIGFKQIPIPQPVAAPEPKADRSFPNRTIPPIKDFTEDQNLDSLIGFKQIPIPQPVAAPEPNDDRSFFDSIIPFIKDFTVDQKLEFRCEILSLIRRMRMSNSSNNTCNNKSLTSTSRQASTSNFIYANLTHPRFHHSFPPPSNFYPNFYPGVRSPLIRTNIHSSPNISSPNFYPGVRSPLIRTNIHSSPNISSPNFFPEVCSLDLTTNSISSTNPSSLQLSQQTVTRCSTAESSADEQSFSDDGN